MHYSEMHYSEVQYGEVQRSMRIAAVRVAAGVPWHQHYRCYPRRLIVVRCNSGALAVRDLVKACSN
jgi:hypothetical protein